MNRKNRQFDRQNDRQFVPLPPTAMVRFWAVVLATYTLLEEEQARLAASQQCHVTSGEARRSLQLLHYRHLLHWISHYRHLLHWISHYRHLLHWISHELHTGTDADALYARLVA